MATLSLWDIGNCNCGCACYPCTLPATNLHIAYFNSVGPVSSTGTLVYDGGCTWATAIGTFFTDFSIGCSGGCTFYESDAGTSISFFDHPANCSGIAGVGGVRNLTLSTFTCSPLNIVLTNGTVSFTITL